MATITSTIRLVDRMTPTLNKISKAVDRLNNNVNKIGNQPSINQLDSKFNKLNSTLSKFNSTANTGWKTFSNGATKATNYTRKLYNALRSTVFLLGTLRGLKGIADIADTMMNATARLNLINDGLYTTSQYLDTIYASTQRSRGSFSNMVTSVSKLGTIAGDAFGSVNEMIAFIELMNKLFVLSGASAAESSNAMYQLTQAMAAGKLQGDEMRSILENAPMLAQKIADKLGVTKGEIKALGAEGKITADIIKEALFDAADEIEEKFEKMPKTIGQIWTEISNYAINAFRPLIERVQKFINSSTFEKIKNRVFAVISAISKGIIYLIDLFETPRIQNAISKICTALSALWEIVTWVGQTMVNIAIWISDNWNWIAPIVYTIVWAFIAYKAILAIVTVAMWAYNAAQLVAGLIAGTVVLTTFGWVLLILVAVIAVIYLAVAAWNHFTGQTVSATGIIFGAIAFVVACIWDLLVFLWDCCCAIVDSIVYLCKLIWQVFIDLIDFLIICLQDILVFLSNCVAAIVVAIVEVGSRLWDTFVWILDVCRVLLINIFQFVGNLLAAVGGALVEIGANIVGTFEWIIEAIKVWASNVSTGMSQLTEALPYYWEYFRASVVEKFWAIISGAVNAFNDLIQSSRDVCVKMLTPFADFANGVKNIFNGIKRLWNGIADKLSAGFDVPDWVIAAGSALGLNISKHVGLSVGKFDIDETPITAEGWIGAIGDLANSADMKHAEAIIYKEMALANIPEVNWNTNAMPSYGDYVNWGSVKDAWNDGMNTFEYQDLPAYDVDWDGTWSAIKEAFTMFEYNNPFDAFNGEDYANDWNEFTKAWDNTWDSSDYSNPMDAYREWYDKGAALEGGISGLIDGIGGLLQGFKGFNGGSTNGGSSEHPYYDPVLGTVVGGGNGSGKDLPKSLEDLLGGAGSGIGDTLGAIADNTGSSAGSASNIEDTLDLAEEELELLRKLAEQDVINRFTTAEIHVDMTNNNNVSSDMDLDGIVTHLSNKLYEELGVVASGVHY